MKSFFLAFIVVGMISGCLTRPMAGRQLLRIHEKYPEIILDKCSKVAPVTSITDTVVKERMEYVTIQCPEDYGWVDEGEGEDETPVPPKPKVVKIKTKSGESAYPLLNGSATIPLTTTDTTINITKKDNAEIKACQIRLDNANNEIAGLERKLERKKGVILTLSLVLAGLLIALFFLLKSKLKNAAPKL